MFMNLWILSQFLRCLIAFVRDTKLANKTEAERLFFEIKMNLKRNP